MSNAAAGTANPVPIPHYFAFGFGWSHLIGTVFGVGRFMSGIGDFGKLSGIFTGVFPAISSHLPFFATNAVPNDERQQ